MSPNLVSSACFFRLLDAGTHKLDGFLDIDLVTSDLVEF